MSQSIKCQSCEVVIAEDEVDILKEKFDIIPTHCHECFEEYSISNEYVKSYVFNVGNFQDKNVDEVIKICKKSIDNKMMLKRILNLRKFRSKDNVRLQAVKDYLNNVLYLRM